MRFADKSMSPTEQLAWGALQKLMGAGKLGMYIAAPDDMDNFPYLCCACDAAALLTMALPGSVYVYQGEELGLWEVEDIPAGRRQDPIWHRTGGADPGARRQPGASLDDVAAGPGRGAVGGPRTGRGAGGDLRGQPARAARRAARPRRDTAGQRAAGRRRPAAGGHRTAVWLRTGPDAERACK
jgi:hypothetical protein